MTAESSVDSNFLTVIGFSTTLEELELEMYCMGGRLWPYRWQALQYTVERLASLISVNGC